MCIYVCNNIKIICTCIWIKLEVGWGLTQKPFTLIQLLEKTIMSMVFFF